MIFWRCPLGTVFLHRVGEYWTDTCELVLKVADFWRWFLQWFGSFSEVSVSIFLHRLEKKERTLSTFSLFSLPIALYLNLFKVSVRYRFPAQAQQKCDLTYTKRHFIPMWFEASLEVSVRAHFYAQAHTKLNRHLRKYLPSWWLEKVHDSSSERVFHLACLEVSA